MVEPFAFLVIEFRAGFGHAVKAELLNQLVHRVQLFVSATVPTEQCQEVNHRLRQITALTITAADCAVFLVVEFQWEHRETQSVAVAFAQFAVSVRLEQ